MRRGSNTNDLSRRAFLTSSLAVAGVAVLPSALHLPGSRRPHRVSSLPDDVTVYRPTYSPVDGLLETFVRAPVTAIGATAVMLWLADGLGMRTSSGSIEVAIDPQTFVHARDRRPGRYFSTAGRRRPVDRYGV